MLGQCVVGRIFEARSSHFENFWQTDKASRTHDITIINEAESITELNVGFVKATHWEPQKVGFYTLFQGEKPYQVNVKLYTVHSGGRDRNLSVFFQSKSFPDVTFSTAITHSRRFDRANIIPP